jgi:hypothetical protein
MTSSVASRRGIDRRSRIHRWILAMSLPSPHRRPAFAPDLLNFQLAIPHRGAPSYVPAREWVSR